MKRAWKIRIVVISVFAGLGLILLIGYYAIAGEQSDSISPKFTEIASLVDMPRELLEQAEKVDITYIKREMPLADLVEMPTGKGNAAQDYIKALKLKDEETAVVRLTRLAGTDFVHNTEAESLDHILAGAQKAECDFAEMQYQTEAGIINYPTPT